jgi:hypothetical protein
LGKFEAAGVAHGGAGAEEDPEASGSASGSEDGDEESTPAKDLLKHDSDYESETTEKGGEGVNATEGADDADQQKKEPPTSPPIPEKTPEQVAQEIIDISKSPGLGPVMERSVVGRDGKKVKCIATLPGREFYSDDIDDAVFDDAKFEPPYVDWTVRATERMSASPECAKAYTHYFSDKIQATVKGNKITAKVGINTLRARDLETLGHQGWLNDQVIDVMTKLLAGRATTESKREVAVFDTQFTKLILECPNKADDFYVYDRVITYAGKRLLGKSPAQFDCLLFPNNITRSHWTIMAVFPKQRKIVCLDSMFNGNIQDARLIFRWLYDEIRYSHPNDEKSMFQPYQPDLGWKYTTDKDLRVQNDSWNCGVFMVGFLHCLLFGINPRHLTPELMVEYRKRIFDDLHGERVKVYPASPWMKYKPGKIIQTSLPPLPGDVSRSIANKRRGTRILSFQAAKDVADNLRKDRAKEKEKRKVEREKRSLEAAKAQRILDEYRKRRQDNIDEANKAVDVLVTGGLGEFMKKKKGKQREKQIKEYLEENLRVPPADDGEEDDDVDDDKKDEDTKSQEQIAKLRFERGRLNADPPDGLRNRYFPYSLSKFKYEYNYFEGMRADNTVFDMQLNPAWCENVFELVFTQLCRQHPGHWIHVPIGSSSGIPRALDSPPLNPVVVRYQQNARAYCLTYSVASCLNYMGHVKEASTVADAAPILVNLPGDKAFDRLRNIISEVLPHMGQCMVWNGKKRKRYKSRKVMSVGEIVTRRTPFLTLVHPKGRDGSVDHAVCVVDDIIFDSTLTHAIKLCEESFHAVCGEEGMAELGRVIRFCIPKGVKHTKPEREERKMKRNWD